MHARSESHVLSLTRRNAVTENYTIIMTLLKAYSRTDVHADFLPFVVITDGCIGESVHSDEGQKFLSSRRLGKRFAEKWASLAQHTVN